MVAIRYVAKKCRCTVALSVPRPVGWRAVRCLDAAVRNMVELTGVTPAEAIHMASLHPARMLGVDGVLGSLKPGKRASVVALDSGLHVQQIWIQGQLACVLIVCSFIWAFTSPVRPFFFFRFDLCSGVGCDANASYSTYDTPHPAIGEHSDVITQFFNLPLSFLSMITISFYFLFLH